MPTTQITRYSQLGFGYTSACKNDEHGNLRVCDVTEPQRTGTVKQISDANSKDRTLLSLQGGTFYTTAWFVKVGNEWRKVKGDQYMHPIDLLSWSTELDWRGAKVKKYHKKSIVVEIE